MKIDIIPCWEYSPTQRMFIDEMEIGLLKPQMFDRLAVVDQLFERIYANAQVHIEIFLCDLFVTL